MPNIKKIFVFSLLVLVVSILISKWSYEFEPKEFIWQTPPSFTGVLESNNALSDAKILLKGQLFAPETLVKEDNVIYTGTGDGKFLKIVNEKIVQTIEKPAKFTDSSIFGLRRLNATHFVAACMLNGLLWVDFNKGKVEFLLPTGVDHNGITIATSNDFDIIDKNIIIFTEPSSRWPVALFGYMFLEHNFGGRVLKYDMAKEKLEVLVDGLSFVNGLLLHPDRESLIAGEFWAARLIRYYFTGPKKGKREYFATNLPGYSDNIRLSSHGTIYVALAAVRDPSSRSWLETLGPYPGIRKAILQIIPEILLKIWVFLASNVQRGLILEYDYNGKLLRSLHDPTGQVMRISHVEDDGEYLYLGSYFKDFIARVDKKKIYG